MTSKRAALLGSKAGDDAEHASRQDEARVEGLFVRVQEAGDVPGGGAHPLPLVEQRVVHRRRVAQWFVPASLEAATSANCLLV